MTPPSDHMTPEGAQIFPQRDISNKRLSEAARRV